VEEPSQEGAFLKRAHAGIQVMGTKSDWQLRSLGTPIEIEINGATWTKASWSLNKRGSDHVVEQAETYLRVAGKSLFFVQVAGMPVASVEYFRAQIDGVIQSMSVQSAMPPRGLTTVTDSK